MFGTSKYLLWPWIVFTNRNIEDNRIFSPIHKFFTPIQSNASKYLKKFTFLFSASRYLIRTWVVFTSYNSNENMCWYKALHQKVFKNSFLENRKSQRKSKYRFLLSISECYIWPLVVFRNRTINTKIAFTLLYVGIKRCVQKFLKFTPQEPQAVVTIWL